MAGEPDGKTLLSAEDTPGERGPAAEREIAGSARYEITGEVGRGGLGLVLRAIDRRLGRPIALKVMTRADAVSVGRFEDEARITARLEHPSIVPVHDAGHLGGTQPFYAMKLVGGRTLASAIDAAPDLAARLGLLGAVIDVADAMAFAHSRGVIHRDLKPDNVLVGEFGETLVIDWGLAKELGRTDEPDRSVAGVIVGTPSYMAPEQARGEPLDFTADVYAIGGLLYAVLTGRSPRRGTRDEILAAARAVPVPRVRTVERDAPPDLAAICDRALSHDPDARYPTARELAEDLRRFQTGQLVAARDYSTAQRLARWIRRHRAVVAMATVSVAVIAVVATVLLVRVFDARRRAEANAVAAASARDRAEEQAARLRLAQARSALDRDPATALAWLARLLDSPGAGTVDLEQVRFLIADARARGVVTDTLGDAAEMVDLNGTPDGRFAVGRSSDGRVVVWDLDARRIHAQLAGPFRDVAIAPDGNAIATVDDAGVVIRGLDGAELRRVPTATPAASVAFAAAGGLVVAGLDGRVRTPDGQELPLDAAVSAVLELAGGRIAFAGTSVIGWWDPRTGEVARGPRDTEPIWMTASRDGGQIAVGSAGFTHLYRVDAHAITMVEELGTGGMAFGPDDVLASAGRAGIVIRQRTGHALELPTPQNAYVAFAGTRLVAANDQARLFVFDTLPVSPERVVRRASSIRYVKAMTGDRIGFTTVAGEVGVIDAAGVARSLSIDPRYYGGDAVYLAAIGDQLVFGGASVWAVDVGTAAVTEIWAATSPACVARLASGDVAIVSSTGELRVYDASLARHQPAVQLEPQVRECAGLPDGTLAVARVGTVAVVDVTTGAERARDVHDDGAGMDALAILPDGTIVTGDFHGEVRAWRPGAPSRLLFRHDGPVWGAAVSPDGALLATCGRDRTVRISTPDGKIVQIFRGHADEISSVAFASTGATVTSSSMDGTILRWSLDPSRAPPSTAEALITHIDKLTAIVVPDAP